MLERHVRAVQLEQRRDVIVARHRLFRRGSAPLLERGRSVRRVRGLGVLIGVLYALHPEGAGRAGARLVLLDALYLYTTREGPLSPSTRQAPATQKGQIRKQLADMLDGEGGSKLAPARIAGLA